MLQHWRFAKLKALLRKAAARSAGSWASPDQRSILDFPDLERKFPDTPIKFPVPILREFAANLLIWRLDSAENSASLIGHRSHAPCDLLD